MYLFPPGTWLPNYIPRHWVGSNEVLVEVEVRPTVSLPVRLGVGLPSRAHDQISVSVRQFRVS
jgi:hypothetical protein